MQLLLFKTLWGHTGDLGSAAMQAQAAGFDGIEGPVPRDAVNANALTRLLAATGLEWIGEICTGGGDDTGVRPRRLPALPAIHRCTGRRPVADQPVDGCHRA